jgi:hypothetical protein
MGEPGSGISGGGTPGMSGGGAIGSGTIWSAADRNPAAHNLFGLESRTGSIDEDGRLSMLTYQICVLQPIVDVLPNLVFGEAVALLNLPSSGSNLTLGALF